MLENIRQIFANLSTMDLSKTRKAIHVQCNVPMLLLTSSPLYILFFFYCQCLPMEYINVVTALFTKSISDHDIAELLLKLALNDNQSIKVC